MRYFLTKKREIHHWNLDNLSWSKRKREGEEEEK